MEYSTIILAVVLGFFGILFILLIVYVVQVNKAKGVVKGASTKMPPRDYMINVGSKCPDYWVDMGADPTRRGYHLCYNQLNIPIGNPNNNVCYSDKAKRIKSFKDVMITEKDEIVDWDGGKEGETEMCRFVSQCGPSNNMTASWLGISSEQMSPGYSSCGSIAAK